MTDFLTIMVCHIMQTYIEFWLQEVLGAIALKTRGSPNTNDTNL